MIVAVNTTIFIAVLFLGIFLVGAAIFAKQITINPWAEDGVTTLSAILTAKQP